MWHFTVYNHQLTKDVIKGNVKGATQTLQQGLLP